MIHYLFRSHFLPSHPIVSTLTAQYSATLFPEEHAKQSAVMARQQILSSCGNSEKGKIYKSLNSSRKKGVDIQSIFI